MMSLQQSRCLMLLLSGLMITGGCATGPTQQTQFYRLNTQSDYPTQLIAPENKPWQQPQVGVGPVHLASYLDRPQIISRQSPYRLELLDFHHWAGKLQENITQVLVDALQARLGVDAVVGYPWHRLVRPTYLVNLDVDRLDAENGRVILQVRWTVEQAEEGKLIDLQQLQIAEPVQGSDPESTVAAASRALTQLALQLGSRLQLLIES